jgi:lysophospholipase L1-like esterase
MPLKVFRFKLPIDNQSSTPYIEVRQGDTGGNMFVPSLTFKGSPFDISGATYATFTVLKEDNTVVAGALAEIVNYGNGEVSFVLTDQCIAIPGEVICSVEIYTGSVRLTSANFTYTVVPDLANEGDPSSSSEYPILTQLIIDVGELETEVGGAEAARIISENARVSAENTRVSQENARVTAETNRSTAETNRSNAETSRANAENIRATSEEDREASETLRESAEATRQSNETVRVNAENLRATVESNRAIAEANREAEHDALIVWEPYSSVKAYEALNKVSYNGSSYIAVAPSTGVTPGTDETKWVQIVAKGDTGDIGVNWSGDYAPVTAYAVNDGVYYNGSSYRAIQATTGNAPTNATYWKPIALKGTDGQGAGDMTKLEYDTDGDGIVNAADYATEAGGITGKPNVATTDGAETLTNKTLTDPKVPLLGKILDYQGETLMEFGGSTIDSTNYLYVNNAPDNSPVMLSTKGTADNVPLWIQTKGLGSIFAKIGSITALLISAVASAVNYLTVGASTTGNPPTISAAGSDANIDINLVPKGTGVVKAGGKEVALQETVDAHLAEDATTEQKGHVQLGITAGKAAEGNHKHNDISAGYGTKAQIPSAPSIAQLYFLTDQKRRIEYNGSEWQYLDGALMGKLNILDGNIYAGTANYNQQTLSLGNSLPGQTVDMTKDFIAYFNLKTADNNDFAHIEFLIGTTLQMQLTFGYDWVGGAANGTSISVHDYINSLNYAIGSFTDFYTTNHDIIVWYDHKWGYLNVYIDNTLIGSFKPAVGGANLDGSNIVNIRAGSGSTTLITLNYIYMAKPLATVIGDSITAGAIAHAPNPDQYVGVDNYGSNYPKLISDYLKSKGIKNYFVVNKGVNSDTTDGMVARFTNDIVNTGCKYVLIHGGINDYPGNLTTETTGNKIGLMNTALANNIEPLLLGVMPTKIENPAHQYSIDLHAAEMATYNPLYYVDLWETIEGTTADVADNAKMADSVHPNLTGYTSIANKIDSFITV